MVGNRGAGPAGDVLGPSPGDGVGARADLDLQRHGGWLHRLLFRVPAELLAHGRQQLVREHVQAA
jgi:hypothetical protein